MVYPVLIGYLLGNTQNCKVKFLPFFYDSKFNSVCVRKILLTGPLQKSFLQFMRWISSIVWLRYNHPVGVISLKKSLLFLVGQNITLWLKLNLNSCLVHIWYKWITWQRKKFRQFRLLTWTSLFVSSFIQ